MKTIGASRRGRLGTIPAAPGMPVGLYGTCEDVFTAQAVNVTATVPQGSVCTILAERLEGGRRVFHVAAEGHDVTDLRAAPGMRHLDVVLGRVALERAAGSVEGWTPLVHEDAP